MFWVHCQLFPWKSRYMAFALMASLCILTLPMRSLSEEPVSTVGRIDFGETRLPPATIEVDLSEGMFSDLFGLGEAAIAGFAEQLRQAAGEHPDAQGTRLAAEQLAAAQQIIKLARGVVREVRVRVYEDVSEENVQPAQLMTGFDSQLQAGQWESVVRARGKDELLQVSLLRDDGAVRGAFILVADGNDLVLANVVGNVSPENVKKLTSAAAKIGLEDGLQQELDKWSRKLQRRMPPSSASLPVPAPPQPSQPQE